MFKRLIAAARRHEPSLGEDLLGIAALFAILFIALGLPTSH